MKEKIKDKVMFLLFTYPVGILLGIGLFLLRISKRIRIMSPERFPRRKRKIIVVSNHPSLLEPMLLPALFFREYLFSPFKYAPWSVPDRHNYYDKWYWFFARPRLLPVERGNNRAGMKVLLRIKEVLDKKGIIIIFPEAGRTFKGNPSDMLESRRGKKLRRFKPGVGWLVIKTRATILPVWVEGTDKMLPNRAGRLFSHPRFSEKAIIKIGNPVRFKTNGNRVVKAGKIADAIANILLQLADE